MFRLGAFEARTRRRRRGSTRAAPDATAALSHADPAKALLMGAIGEFVADGHAEWDLLANGDIQLRFNTGETFLLTQAVVIRLA